MTTLEVIADSTGDAAARAPAATQEMCDSAMAVLAEMHQDWYKLSRQILGQSLPWPPREDFADAA